MGPSCVDGERSPDLVGARRWSRWSGGVDALARQVADQVLTQVAVLPADDLRRGDAPAAALVAQLVGRQAQQRRGLGLRVGKSAFGQLLSGLFQPGQGDLDDLLDEL